MRRVWIVVILFLFSMSMMNPLDTRTLQENESDRSVIPCQLLNIERTWTANIIVVNYDQSLIDETILLSGMPTERNYATDNVFITYNIEYNVHYANQNYIDDLSQIVTDNSVNGSETGTYLNETALDYQRNHLDDPQRVFYPRAGRVIDAYAVEEWLEDNHYVTPPSLGYTLYLVNFSSLDTAGGLEHWYDYHPEDPDTGEEQDWFRLEWDNALNPDVTMDYANFGGRFNTFVVDPSAHQWYLKWCRIWWRDRIVTEYDFWTQDLEDKVASLDLENPTDVDALNVYLQECIWDPINLLFFPYQHMSPAKFVQTGLLRSLVICMDVADGTSVDSLRWVTNAEMQKAHLEELYPFISWDVQVDFLDIDEHPLWNTTFWNYAEVDPDNVTIVDGYGMFGEIDDNVKPLNIDVDDPNINVFGVVFIKKHMEMHIGEETYTGLGGGGQTVIWKSWERYYRADGVTPKDGVSGVQLHETMHAIGFHHTWQHEHYSGDFSFGPMGYFAFHNGTALFDKNWVQGTYLDQMEAIIRDDFASKQAELGTDERAETYKAEQKVIRLLDDASEFYNEMDWLAAYDALSAAEDWIKRMYWSTQDDTAPVISEWKATPEITTAGFDVWVEVTDDLSGIENVTVYVQDEGGEITLYPCSENAAMWNASIPSFATTSNLEIWVVAWDWGMNSAESSHETTPPDYTLLTYIVIISGIAVIVIIVIIVIRKR